MLTRRAVLKAAMGLGLTAFGFTGYALGVEPWAHRITRYRPRLSRWPQGAHLRIALVADIHACEPWMDLERVERIVADTNALAPDLILLLGDYMAHHRFVRRPIPTADWARVLGGLKAPLGVHAVLGNHDWWDDEEAQLRQKGPTRTQRALEAHGIPVYENDARRLATREGQAFWLAGLGDQWAFQRSRRGRKRRIGSIRGIDDLPATLARITDDAPVLMMMHEPDAFTNVPARVALTVAGHTHGGQIAIAGFAPIVPSRYGRRFAYGHVIEEGRHLIVSGGLGCSMMPMRFGVPPEIVLVELGGRDV
jgi:predicted MPP superfamily phosphohydrolase